MLIVLLVCMAAMALNAYLVRRRGRCPVCGGHQITRADGLRLGRWSRRQPEAGSGKLYRCACGEQLIDRGDRHGLVIRDAPQEPPSARVVRRH